MKKHYTIETQTGNVESAGTDARVYVQFITGVEGSEIRSSEIRLDNKDRDDFVRGATDRFEVYEEDIGWIDRIRFFHDNSGDGPGLFLNYVKVLDNSNGLEWQANFNRWLATNMADHEIDVISDIPITVNLGSGILTRMYIGYTIRRYANTSLSALKVTDTLKTNYKKGVSFDKTTSYSVKTGAVLGFDFFTKAEFSVEVAYAVAEKNGSTSEETIEHSQQIEHTVQPNEKITVIALYFQNILKGDVEAGGVVGSYQQKFDIDSNVLVVGEELADQDVQKYIQNWLAGISPIAGDPDQFNPDTEIVLQKIQLQEINKHSLDDAINRIKSGVTPATIIAHFAAMPHFATIKLPDTIRSSARIIRP